jgi:hypothetical protein
MNPDSMAQFRPGMGPLARAARRWRVGEIPDGELLKHFDEYLGPDGQEQWFRALLHEGAVQLRNIGAPAITPETPPERYAFAFLASIAGVYDELVSGRPVDREFVGACCNTIESIAAKLPPKEPAADAGHFEWLAHGLANLN